MNYKVFSTAEERIEKNVSGVNYKTSVEFYGGRFNNIIKSVRTTGRASVTNYERLNTVLNNKAGIIAGFVGWSYNNSNKYEKQRRQYCVLDYRDLAFSTAENSAENCNKLLLDLAGDLINEAGALAVSFSGVCKCKDGVLFNARIYAIENNYQLKNYINRL